MAAGVLKASASTSAWGCLDLPTAKGWPALDLPSTWHPSFWTQMGLCDHMAFYKYIYKIIIFYIYMCICICVSIYTCITHIYDSCHQHVKKDWKTHSCLLLLARTWFAPPCQSTASNGNFGNLLLSHQPASQPGPKGQFRNLFVMSNCWASLNTRFSSGATCHTLKHAGSGSGKLEPRANSAARSTLASNTGEPICLRLSRRRPMVEVLVRWQGPSPPPAATPSSFHTSIMNQAPTH